jgi:hypothetical protein
VRSFGQEQEWWEEQKGVQVWLEERVQFWQRGLQALWMFPHDWMARAQVKVSMLMLELVVVMPFPQRLF